MVHFIAANSLQHAKAHSQLKDNISTLVLVAFAVQFYVFRHPVHSRDVTLKLQPIQQTLVVEAKRSKREGPRRILLHRKHQGSGDGLLPQFGDEVYSEAEAATLPHEQRG